MSFIISLYVREGIVMASDSRLTLNLSQKKNEENIHHIAIGQSDSTYKTFLTPHGYGISLFGGADINGVPIAGFVESFINEELGPEKLDIDSVPQRLKDYFQNINPQLNTGFHIAGFKQEKGKMVQRVWLVHIKDDVIKELNPKNQLGASWAGEGDIMARLIQPVSAHEKGNQLKMLPNYQIPWSFFTLQDAIDFAVYAVRTTIDSIRFQTRPKTVGGPIDVLVIKADGAFWIKRKELRVKD